MAPLLLFGACFLHLSSRGKCAPRFPSLLPNPFCCSPGGNTANCIKVSAETTTAIALGQLQGAECEAKLVSREDPVTQLYQVTALFWKVTVQHCCVVRRPHCCYHEQSNQRAVGSALAPHSRTAEFRRQHAPPGASTQH